MAANDFLVFGGGAGANVITQVTYSGLAARTSGFQSGVAQSEQLNKVWRQSSIMAAVLAQFISDQTGLDVLDDGTTATILGNLKASIPGRVLRTTIYARVGGVQQVSVDGGAYSTTGATTFTPLSLTKAVDVELVGGGGAGGGCGAASAGQGSDSVGGCGGGYARKVIRSGFGGQTITVGAGGAAPAAGANNGGNGGTSSFGAIVSATGGSGGPGYAATSGLPAYGNPLPSFPPGSGAGGDINGVGGLPTCALLGTSSPSSIVPSAGGTSFFGSGGYTVVNVAGVAGVAPGSAGSGVASSASSGALAGGAGASGIVIVREYA